ncbi:alpha/beta fold hydrolase [Lysinibacillus sp. KU-BSD001]|uniref:alpha/beta hydrolase n=1 Tax=Lysinibacillus sp. KU-BSD001 TaxID=3141328 RepID=UPI0036EB2E1D
MTVGVLFLHGFSGGPYEIQPFANYIKENTTWVIKTPTFLGHGDADALAMEGYKAEHWLMDAEIAYRKLAKQVDEIIIVGFSMGGVMAMYLAKRYRVKKLVLLSAAAKYVSPSQLVKDIHTMADDAFHRKLKENELFRRYQHKFQNVPLSATIQFMKIVRKTEPYIGHITCPVFIVQGALDGIVPSVTAQMLYDKIPAKRKLLYISECGKHHICYSDDCDEWFSKALRFLLEL